MALRASVHVVHVINKNRDLNQCAAVWAGSGEYHNVMEEGWTMALQTWTTIVANLGLCDEVMGEGGNP